MKHTDMQHWIWQQLSLNVPADWEMLQFSKESAKGNCAFADRYMFRLEVNWRTFDDWPDFERMLDDYQQKLEKSQGMSGFEPDTIGAWHGFHCKGTTGESSRFGRYFESSSKLVEVVLLWENGVDRKSLNDILGSVKLVLPNDGEQRWRAFGMDLFTGAEMFLEDCQVQPARTTLTFSDKEQRPGRQDCFERLGMVDEWLKCDLKVWLDTKKPAFVSDVNVIQKSHAHHKIYLAQGPAPALNFPRFRKDRNWYAAAAWICPNDGRLYYASRIQPAKAKRHTLFGQALACCDSVTKETNV